MTKKHGLAYCLIALLPLLPKNEKWRFFFLLALSTVMALSELLLAGIVALLAAIFSAPETVLNKKMLWLHGYDIFGSASDPRLLALVGLVGVLLAVLFKNVLVMLQQWQLTDFTESIGRIAQSHLFRFYQKVPYPWIISEGAAQLGFGMRASANLSSTLTTLLELFASAVMLVTMLVGLISISPLPSLLLLSVLGAGGYLIVKKTRNFLDRQSLALYNLSIDLTKITHVGLHGLKEIRLCNRENQIYAAYLAYLTEYSDKRRMLTIFGKVPVVGLETLGFLTLVVVMAFLIFVRNTDMAHISGIIGFMAAAAWRTLPVASRLADAMTRVRVSLPFLQKTVELITLEQELQPELLPLADTAHPLLFSHEISLDRVTFKYPEANTPSVNNISLVLKKGSMLGIIGSSGAGKTTIVNLLAGLMVPTEGRILVDGVPLAIDNVRSWQQRIGYVSQAPYLIDATLAENVAFACWGEKPDRERVLHCCRIAAVDFLEQLENGIDTPLGDRGVRLSGGQMQRVAIARALYTKPDLIIFDEGTNALDVKNEAAIQDTILSLRNTATMVIIAHRLSSIACCDYLVWLDKGEVVQAGPREKVLEKYKEAMCSQPENAT